MKIEQHGDQALVIPPERIDLTNAAKFKETLQSLYDQGYRIIVINCTNLALMDSAGLGTLVMFQQKLKAQGGELKIVNVNHGYIRHLFKMIELEKIIKISEENS